jgi:hypothetical protein
LNFIYLNITKTNDFIYSLNAIIPSLFPLIINRTQVNRSSESE